MTHTGVFGCNAWVQQGKQTATERNTFDAKALPGIYLGHDDSMHGALVHLLGSGKVVRTRDVELREDSFTHMKAYRTGVPSETLARTSADAPAPEAPAPRATGAADEQPNDEQYEVERITRKRVAASGTQYCVKWKGCYTLSWEPAANLVDAADALAEYEQQARSKPAARTSEPSHEPRAAAAPAQRVTRSALKHRVEFAHPVDDSADDASSEVSYAAMAVLTAPSGCSRL